MISGKIFYFILILIIGVVLWGPFYTQDGPNHRKTATILYRLNANPIEAETYSSGLGVLKTNTLFHAGYHPLKNRMTIRQYERLYFAIFLSLIWLSFRRFLRIRSPHLKSHWVLALPFLLHPLYLRGFYNYMASVAFSLLALGVVAQQRRKEKFSWRLFPIYFVLCWLCQLAHPFSFFILPLGIFCFVLEEGRNARIRKLLPYFLLSILYLALQFILPLMSNGIGGKTPYAFASLPILLGGLIGLDFMDFTLYPLVAAFPFLCLLGYTCVKNVSAEGFRKNLLWLAPLAAYFLFPRSGGGSAHMNERFLPFIFFFIPASLSPQAAPRCLRVLKGASYALFAIVMASYLYGMYGLERKETEAREVLSHLPPVSKLYPINFNLRGAGRINWHLAHIWAVYPEEKVVFSPYLFALPDFTPLKKPKMNAVDYFPATEEDFPRQKLEASCASGFLYDTKDCASEKERALQTIFESARYYDYWFVHRENEIFAAYLRQVPGLEEVARKGDFSLWHYTKALPFNPQSFSRSF